MGNNKNNQCVPLVNIGYNKFMIKTKDDHVELASFLNDWIADNAWQIQKEYKKIIERTIRISCPVLDKKDQKYSYSQTCLRKLDVVYSDQPDGDYDVDRSVKSTPDVPDEKFEECCIDSMSDLCVQGQSHDNAERIGKNVKKKVKTNSPDNSNCDISKMESELLDKQSECEGMIVENIGNSQPSNYLFIGFKNGTLKRWDINKKKIINNYGQIFTVGKTGILSMAITKDSKYLFLGDGNKDHVENDAQSGTLIKWDVQKEEIVKIHKNTHSRGILSMAITSDNQYLFTLGRELKQWDITSDSQLKNYGFPLENEAVNLLCHTSSADNLISLGLTSDNKFQLTGLAFGKTIMWNIQKQKLIKSFGKSNDTAHSIIVTSDNNQLLVMANGSLKQFDINTQKMMNDYDKKNHPMLSSANSTVVTSDNQYLFVGHINGDVMQWNINKQIFVRNYVGFHQDSVTSMVVTNDNQYLFSADNQGYLKQWDIQGEKLCEQFRVSEQCHGVQAMIVFC